MTKIIVYASANLKHIGELQRLGLEHFIVIKKIKEDIKKIQEIIEKDEIGYIIGFGNGYKTRQETKVINNFHNLRR